MKKAGEPSSVVDRALLKDPKVAAIFNESFDNYLVTKGRSSDVDVICIHKFALNIDISTTLIHTFYIYIYNMLGRSCL